ncbi:MAG: radical SAM protein [Proteobacteria bacterium]|nr:radical SAM protein [Pseudomonadota bacterium]
MRLTKIGRTLAAILGSRRPVILYHKPTASCDCRCRFCDVWINQQAVDDVLPVEEGLRLIDQAERADMSMYVAWGGEPLLAEALPNWLRRAWDYGMRTVVCTSGSRLTERAAEIGPVTERLLLSVDGVGQKHDRLRGRPGLFAKMVAGLNEYKKYGHEVIIWSHINRDNSDQIEEILRLAKEHKIGVEFFPTARIEGFNEKIILSGTELKDVFARIMAAKRRGWPVLNTFYTLQLMGSNRPFVCNTPQLSVQVAADGNVYACESRVIAGLEAYGHIDDLDLESLFASQKFKDTCRDLRACNACRLPCVADMSDNLQFQVARKTLNRSFYRLFK